MLDHLPLELIQLIVRHALPSHYSPSTYRERQGNLLALCKTSRLLRTVAQPVLFEVVELKGVGGVERFVKVVKGNALGERVRTLRVEPPHAYGAVAFAAGEAEGVVKAVPNVVDLRLCRVRMNVRVLEGLKDLRRLVASHCDFTASSSFSLPRLRELSLFCTQYDFDTHFTSATCPGLLSAYIQLAAYPLAIEPNLLHLFRQVPCLSLDSLDVSGQKGAAILTSPRILLDFYPNHLVQLVSRRPPFLAVSEDWRLSPFASSCELDEHGVGVEDACATDLIPYLPSLAEAFKKQGAALPARLYLPIAIQPGSNGFLMPLQREEVTQFILVCEDVGIKVIFERLPDPLRESPVSPVFWRRCKALKTKEQEVEAGKEKTGEEEGDGGKKK